MTTCIKFFYTYFSGIHAALYGDLCLSISPIQYLLNKVSKCVLKLPQQEVACTQQIRKIISSYTDVKIISSPKDINQTDLPGSIKVSFSSFKFLVGCR